MTLGISFWKRRILRGACQGSGQVGLMIHLPGQNLGCPKNHCKIMQHFQDRLCGKREQLCGRLQDFFKTYFKLDCPFLRINSNSSCV